MTQSNPKPVEGALREALERVMAVPITQKYEGELVAEVPAVDMLALREAALSAAPARDGVREALETLLTQLERNVSEGEDGGGHWYRLHNGLIAQMEVARRTLVAAKEQADGQMVLANRCMRHRHIKPMNAVCADGAECPICALHISPDTKDCVRCGAPRESTIHDTESGNTEIRMAAHQFVAGASE